MTKIGEFLYNAYYLKVSRALEQYKQGLVDKGKGAEMAGLSLEKFDEVLGGS